MTQERTPARAPDGRPSGAARLARALADRSPWLLPLAVVAGAATLGVLRSAGAAILILAGGTLLGIITLLWKSLQMLVGEAPLSLEAALDLSAASAADEQKQAVLRALKDLEYERGLGKLSDDDYRELSARYRAEAKAVMRSIDETLGPARERAEKLIAAELGAQALEADKPKKKKKRADAAKAGPSEAPGPADEPGSPAAANVDTNPLDGTAAATSPIPGVGPAPAKPLEVPALKTPDAPAASDASAAKAETAEAHEGAPKSSAAGAAGAAVAAATGEAAPKADARLCPSCSLRNDVDASFCKACGTRLGSVAGAAPLEAMNALRLRPRRALASALTLALAPALASPLWAAPEPAPSAPGAARPPAGAASAAGRPATGAGAGAGSAGA
ncbi:MAG TPA: zinc ribbon domain-containing protein, partial [Polyangiaceae bacterium]|nr:zinc ribbon domain-containing protein [Polyangiaceae bacterium]